MKRYPVKPNTVIPETPHDLGPTEAFDVVVLLNKGGEILRREIQNLMIESSGRKLGPQSSRDLVAYLRLLSELKAEQMKELESLTDEELEALNKS